MKNGDTIETINGVGTIREIRNQGGQVILLITIGRTTDVFTLDEVNQEENP